MLRHHLLWVFDRCQVVNPIPFLQQVYIGQKMLALDIRHGPGALAAAAAVVAGA
jgi:hypothetical protein